MATLSAKVSIETAFITGDQADGSRASGISASSGGVIACSSETTLPYAMDTYGFVDGTQNIRDFDKSGGIVIGVGDSGAVVVINDSDPIGTAVTSKPTTSNLKSIVRYSTSWVAVGDGDEVIRSTNNGSSWSTITASSDGVTFYGVASNGSGGIMIVGSDGNVWLSSNSGAAFTEKSLGITADLYSVSSNGTSWVVCGSGGYIGVINSAASSVSSVSSGKTESLRVVLNNKIICGDGGTTLVMNDALTAVTDSTVAAFADDVTGGYYDSTLGLYFVTTSSGGIYYTSTGLTVGDWGTFSPLSDTYRANDYAVLNGYSILIGTSEYDSTEGWRYNSRRIRWTSPGTLLDFASTGAGAGDLNGRGNLICGVVVNERLVLFESESISAIVPTGIVADPWNYEKIHEGLWSLSNPVVAQDKVYFIGSDGLVYITNGISVAPMDTAFDLTEFTDFTREDVVILAYSSELQSLLVFVPPADENDDRALHVVNTENGGYSTIELPLFTISSDDYIPKTIIARNDNYLSTVMVSYVLADGTATASLLTVEFDFDGTGLIDTLSTDTDTYHMEMLTGDIDFTDESQKASIKHIIFDVYSDAATAGEIGVQVKSSEDSAWWSANDFNGTFTIDGTALSLTGSAISNKIAASGESGTAGAFAIPCLASQARVYVGSALQTLGTDYTASGTSEITMTTVPLTGDLYVYWENEPEIRVNANDLFLDEDGKIHRLTTITDYNTGVVTPGTSSSKSATHIPAETVSSSGSSEISLGLNKLVDGAQIKVYVVPRTATAGTLKITGMRVGYLPTSAQKRVS